ncbi:MAG: tRNA 2-selenouridine(34) synthase MnmH [Planctomycetes bacterium]|nr:tRNA 2-selenouridine(34) synthase MnmH [Planctomycetota bacterium]
MAAELHESLPSLTAEQLLALPERVCIDLRSPSEFAEDHVPGAVNLPLFDDVERAVIGTLYRRESPQAAFEEARGIARRKLFDLVASIARVAGSELPSADLEARFARLTEHGIATLERGLEVLPDGRPIARPIVLHCWRGGLRSRSVVALVRGLGLSDARLLIGGYRAYRQGVVRTLAEWSAPASFVLRGWTGVGKTLVLRELERLRPGWTIDLEAAAGHRSSILGMVGLEPCSQKAFESRLAARVRAGFPGPVVFEGESRKVGDAIVPPALWDALDRGTNLLLEAPVERRIDVLLADYLERAESRAELRAQLPFIEERLGKVKWKGKLVALLDRGEERELVRTLLELYYDPLYRHSEKGRHYAATIDATDPARAARAVAEHVEASLRR